MRIQEIIYIEHNCRTVFLYTMRGVIYIPYVSLNWIQSTLGTDYFYRCHKSFLVNRLYIDKINRTENTIVLKNYMGTISMGRKYKPALLERMHYI